MQRMHTMHQDRPVLLSSCIRMIQAAYVHLWSEFISYHEPRSLRLLGILAHLDLDGHNQQGPKIEPGPLRPMIPPTKVIVCISAANTPAYNTRRIVDVIELEASLSVW